MPVSPQPAPPAGFLIPTSEPRDAATSGAQTPEIGARMPDQRMRHRAHTTVLAARNLAPREKDDGSPEPPSAFEEAPGAKYAVYFITTAYMEPLYIGSTGQLLHRLQEHARQRDWFTPDCRIFVEWFHSESDARLREAHAIFETRPKHNRRMDAPSGPCPDPDVPLRPLVDLDRDVAAMCRNCGMACIRTGSLCATCGNYRRHHGVDRPAQLFRAN